MINVRSLKQFEVVEGTTWKPDHDEFGTSFTCVECGHHEFYADKVPKPCKHNPKAYEKAMHDEKQERV